MYPTMTGGGYSPVGGGPGSNNYNTMANIGTGAALGGGLAGLFGGRGRNPSQAAGQYLDPLQGQMQGIYNPYIQAGTGQIPGLQQQYGQLTNDPGAFLARLGQGYHQSPGYQFNVDQATKAANQAAAAGGMVGSPAEQQQLAQQISGIASQDYNNYLQNVMGLYGQGLSGMQGLYGGGLNASNNMANMQAQIANAQAANAFSGQNTQNQQNAQRSGGFGSALGGLAGLAFGGPIGGGIGSFLGGLFNK